MEHCQERKALASLFSFLRTHILLLLRPNISQAQEEKKMNFLIIAILHIGRMQLRSATYISIISASFKNISNKSLGNSNTYIRQ